MPPKGLLRRLQVALVLNASIVAAEFAVGLKINSVGLMTDAGHNCIDQGALFLTLYAHLLAQRPATAERTFGWHRAGIVTAFGNSLLLLITAAGLAFMALKRLLAPVPVAGAWVIGTALLSFAANMGIAVALQKGSEHDLNIRGAFWHMLGDAWVSLGVAASGGLILLTHWYALDPLISFVIVAVIVQGAWKVLRESLLILLEATPAGLPLRKLTAAIAEEDGVRGVHDLHVWSLTSGMRCMTCHVVAEPSGEDERSRLASRVREAAHRFDVRHVTVEIEAKPCGGEDELHCELRDFKPEHRHKEGVL